MLVAGHHFALPSAEYVERTGAGHWLAPVAWSSAT